MDVVDVKALNHLMKSGRSTWSDLGAILGMSSQSAADRVRRLEETGVIKKYAAIVDPVRAGLTLTAFVSVRLEHPRYRTAFLELVDSLKAVQECHHVTGDYDYLLKVRCASTLVLEHLVSEQLKGLAGVARTTTIVALSTMKETTELHLDAFGSNQANSNR